MVDCGNPRCAQERRSFRKELLSWGKKIPVLLAYEAIAGQIGGEEVSSELTKCFSSLENDAGPQDFAPEKECIYCESKLASIVDIVSKLTDDAKKGRIDPDNAHLRYLHDLLPFCTQYYTQNIKKETDKQGRSGGDQSEDSQLILACKSHIELKVPHIPPQPGKSKKDFIQNGKRGYTDDDLVSAVGDIRSGKLGTRRASTLYGIPRSTLRNKIFKMEIEDQNSIAEEPEDSNSVDDATSDSSSNMKLTDLMQTGNLAFLPPLPFLLPYQKESELTPEELQKKMEHLRHKHNIDGTRETSPKPAHINELKLPLLADLIHKLVEQRFEMECQKSASKKKSNGSETKSDHPTLTSPYYSPLTAAYLSSMNTTEDSDIRIPSYKSATTNTSNQLSEKSKMYGKVYESGRIGETLKDIIMKTITEKMRFKDGSDSSSEAEISSPLKTHLINRCPQVNIPSTKPSANSHNNSRRKKENERVEKVSPASNTIKKTRPKRGQYRKYNSALLMEAVRAVQRGEMSVHRAGSYYGVPHSTLEYKVKERHLLRQKKLRDTQPTKESKTVSSTSTTDTMTSAKTPTKSETAKSALGFSPAKDSTNNLPWYQPYLNANPEFKSDVNFFPSSFALSTPASELLRKLQHKVQSKSSPFNSESSFDFSGSNNVQVHSKAVASMNE